MNDNKPVVLPSDANAATYRTDIKGWVSRHGRFYGNDERTARYDGSTHGVCSCGAVTKKSRLFCPSCEDKRDLERWLALPVVEWDGMTPLCEDDTYFFSYDDVISHCDSNLVNPSDLRLVLCKPNYAAHLDASYWEGDLAEDRDVPEWLEKAIEAFNEVIAAQREPLSWSAGKFRVVLPDGGEAKPKGKPKAPEPREKKR